MRSPGQRRPAGVASREIIPSREFYDYEAKYLDESSKTVIPAELTEAQVREVQRQSIAAFRAVDCAGMARVDFFLARDIGDIFLNEVNTIPGFTTISMYPKMWEASGVSYPELIDSTHRARARAARRKAAAAHQHYLVGCINCCTAIYDSPSNEISLGATTERPDVIWERHTTRWASCGRSSPLRS
jgi:D-alanine-D-alanine ligase